METSNDFGRKEEGASEEEGEEEGGGERGEEREEELALDEDGVVSGEEYIADVDAGIETFLPFELRVLDSIMESFVELKREEMRVVGERVRRYAECFSQNSYSTHGQVCCSLSFSFSHAHSHSI